MWDGLFTLLSLSSIMAIASFFAGSLPLSFSLSPRQLRFITTIGTGVLVGTALIVIIPEGVETLYNSVSIQDQKTLVPERLANPLKGAVAKAGLHKLPLPDDIRRDSIDEGEDITSIALLKRDFSLSPNPTNSRTLHVRDEGEHDDKSSPHAWVGISLISGFILMYLIDTLPPLSSTPSPAPQHISLHELGSSEPSSAAVAQPPSNNHHSSATTIGLLIHAAADGIALGAALAAPTANAALGPAVFAAIMLHKAPVAFGLAAALLRQRRAKRAVRAHLAVFSLAAPAGAVVTWFLVGLVGGVGTKAADGAWWTGVVLVFSGGTFLYVAMHAMQHGAEADNHFDGAYDGGILGPQAVTRTSRKGDVTDVALMVVGMLLPLLTQIGHAHAHIE